MKRILFCFAMIFSTVAVSASDSNQKSIIYIYHDNGVSKESVEHTQYTLNEIAPDYEVRLIKAKEIIENKWSEEAALLIMPGGADLPYCQSLNGQGNANIKAYVKNGGAYLGFCAGSYYGSSYVEFDKGGKLQVLGARELVFFPGQAIGPILAKYDYLTNSGARAAEISLQLASLKETTVYYNGGGYFKDADQYKDKGISVIGSYKNKLPAIIHISYGKGNVILSGVHFEYEPKLLDANDPDYKKILSDLEKGNKTRKQLFKDVLKCLGLTIN